MRHPVHGRLMALVAILLSSSWLAAADGKLDLSTPRKTSTAFAMVLQRGDLATLRMVAVGSADDFKLMQSVTGMTAAATQLNDAATARFGAEDGKKFARTMGSAPEQNDIPRQIAESEEKIEGDSASITMKGTQAANAISLKKVDGEWKVDLARFPRREEIAQQAPILDAGVKVLVQGAADVRAGKYKTPEEAGQDIQRQMIMVMTSVGRQQMQGGASPAAYHTGSQLIPYYTPTSSRPLTLSRGLLGTWTVGVLLFLYLPIVLIVVFSFNRSSLNVLWEGFALRWYAQVWRDAPLMTALKNSVIIASVTTVASSLLGTTAGWLLYRYRFPAARLVQGLIFFPMIVPEIIMGVSLLLLFGVLGWELGFTTVIIGHVTFCFPFVMIAVAARLQGLDPSLEEAAMDLGATPPQAFVRVIVPYLLPAIVAGALMAFTLSIDEFVVTYFTYRAASVTLPVKIYGMIKPGIDPSVNALSTLLIVATVVLALAADAVRRLSSVNPSIK